MKKKFTVFLSAALVLGGLAACSPAAPSPAPTADAVAPVASSESTEPVATVAPAATPEPTMPTEGTTEEITIPAPSLAGNLIDEPAEQNVAIYLPPSYTVSDQGYPVLYYLTGFRSPHLNYQGDLRIITSVMRGILQGGGTEMIVVSIDGVNRLGGSFYHNSPVTGNWEDYVVKDVVSYIDSHYRTIPEAAARGLTGYSMGGYGAISIAMHTQDVFGSVYALSANLFDEEGLALSPLDFESLAAKREELSAMDADAAREAYLTYVDGLSAQSSFSLAYGAAFAPDPEGAPYLLPPEGDTQDETRALYNAGYGDIAAELDQYGDNLKALDALVFETGDREDNSTWILPGNAYLDEQLTQREIPHEYRTSPVGHEIDFLIGRMKEEILPFFSELFAAL